MSHFEWEARSNPSVPTRFSLHLDAVNKDKGTIDLSFSEDFSLVSPLAIVKTRRLQAKARAATSTNVDEPKPCRLRRALVGLEARLFPGLTRVSRG